MKAFAICVLTLIITTLAVPVFAVEQNTVLPVETWTKIGEEREVLAQRTGAGIIKRYYIDPMQHNGIGSTMSVFYKDGLEDLLWKGWDLYTDKGRYAVKFKDSFYLAPTAGPMTSNMMTLSAAVDHLKRAGYDPNSQK